MMLEMVADITYGSLVTLEMEGQVEDIALWDTVFSSVSSSSALHILDAYINAEGHVAFPCINIFTWHSMYILHTAEIVVR